MLDSALQGLLCILAPRFLCVMIAGIIIGLAQTLGGFLLDPAYKFAIVFFIYLIVVWIRPQGLLGW